jgi:hypothetical protein
MSDVVKGVDTVIAGGTLVTLADGSEVSVRVVNGRTLPKVMAFIGTVAADLNLKLSDADTIKDALIAKLDDVGFLLKLIANYSNAIYEIMALTTSLGTTDAVEELTLEDLVIVGQKVLEVNRNFFTDRIIPLLRSLESKQS